MAPAMLAPAMMAKAENAAATVMREMRQEICVLRFNDDLDLVGPKEKYCFKLAITPALISSVGGLALLIYLAWAANRYGWKWDPFGIGKFNFGDLTKSLTEKATEAGDNWNKGWEDARKKLGL